MRNQEKCAGKEAQNAQNKKGILTRLRRSLERNRLGELLVSGKIITDEQLKNALLIQKNEKRALGEILLEQNLVGSAQLRFVLARQSCLRITAAIIFCTASMGSFKKAKASDYIKDVPARISISASQHFAAVAPIPGLFGTDEKRSEDLKPFVKWTGMFDRFDRELNSKEAQAEINKWQKSLRRYEGMSLKKMASGINEFVNETRYITDSNNYGKSDYWATPVEFLQRGGDCEDFAIAKYTALRSLGVPEERLRIAIVHDNIKNIPHAILIVYTDEGAYALDNQNEKLVDAERMARYKPIFSINRQAWWLHTAPKGTVLASAQ